MSSGATKAYANLKDRFGQVARLKSARSVLFWDSQTNMPSGGAGARGEQNAVLTEIGHALIDAPEVGDWLGAVQADVLAPDDRANLDGMSKAYAHAHAVPRALLVAEARLCAQLNVAWQAARAASAWRIFSSGFRELLVVYRDISNAKSKALGLKPYDALMDVTDPGITMAMIDPIFDDLERSLPQLLAEAREVQTRLPAPNFTSSSFPIERQRMLAERLVRTVGHARENIRIDAAPHAFVMVDNPGDVRISIRLDERNFMPSLRSTLHESGHAMYEFNRPKEWAYQPVGAPRGATVHEGQALMLELQAGRSPEFLRFVAPLLADAYGGDVGQWRVENIIRAQRQVADGFIRVEANEIAYPLHIILRYRIEQALLAGDLDVDDVPGAWSDLSQQLFGFRPPNDAKGPLQDFHWANGFFAYFPSYTLGAVLAAQLFEAATRADTAIRPALERGDFGPYFAWLKPNVHQKASRLPFDQLVRQASGMPFSADPFKQHLRARYIEEGL